MDALSNGLVYKLALMFFKWCEYFLKDFDLLVIFIFGEVNGLPGPLASTHLICFTANNAICVLNIKISFEKSLNCSIKVNKII